MPIPVGLTEEQLTTLTADLKAFLSGKVDESKSPIIAELKELFGEPDTEARKLLDVKIGEMEDQIKELMKPKSKGMQKVDDAYGELYGKGVEGWGQFAIDVKEWAYGRQEERLKQYKAAGAGLQENVDSEGGFLVPTEESRELLVLATAESQLYSRVRKMPMGSNTLKLNYIKDTDRSSGALFGGVRMYWTAEEGSTTATKPALAEVTLSLNKLFGMTYATSELIEDSPISIGPWLSQQFATAFGWQMDYEIINGSGTGRPQGILNSPALIANSEEANQTATTIVANNVIKMYARMPALNKRNAIWLTNEDCMPQLMTMEIVVGAAGVPAWLPANGLANQPFQTFFGKELVETEHCQTLGTAGDLIFFDPTQYLMGQKSASVRMDISIHLKFETDETAFRFIHRVDGRCPWPSDLTPRHSSSTLSPIVVTETRDG
jgi:HK97 family phage major capsid protein